MAVGENDAPEAEVDAQVAGVLATTANTQDDFELREQTNRVEAELIANDDTHVRANTPLPCREGFFDILPLDFHADFPLDTTGEAASR